LDLLFGWCVKFGGVEFAGHSPPCGQYEYGRGRSFEFQRNYGPRVPFCGARTPPVSWEWFPRGGHSFDRMDFANPSVESVAPSRS
jgi:hypothetical protein